MNPHRTPFPNTNLRFAEAALWRDAPAERPAPSKGGQLRSGPGLPSAARRRADQDKSLFRAPWQAWRTPTWEEIFAVEAKETAKCKQP